MPSSSQAHTYTPSSLYSRISLLVLPRGETAAPHAVHTVKRIIRRLKRHLHKRIGTKPMTCHKHFPKTLKHQRLTIILASQVTQPRLISSSTTNCSNAGVTSRLVLSLTCFYHSPEQRLNHAAWLSTPRAASSSALPTDHHWAAI